MKYMLFILFSGILFSAEIETKLEREFITRGSDNSLTVTIYGQDIDLPTVSEIGGVRVTGISKENFFHSVNGSITRGMKVRYSFSPEENGTVEPMRFEVDGESVWSRKVDFFVVEPHQNKSDPFQLEIVSEKRKYYLGETIEVRAIYKEDTTKDVIERRYEEPSGDGFWKRGNSQVFKKVEGTNSILEIIYTFSPQKVGTHYINSAKMRVGVRSRRRDSWGFPFETVKWNEVISNRIHIEVVPAPAKLVGEFDIYTEVDKLEVKSGEAVNLKLEIVGDGNLEDLKPFGINIRNGVVYDEKPEISHQISKDNAISTYTQKFAIILDKNGTIPEIELEYFNPNSGKIVVKKSRPIPIVVVGNSRSSKAILEKRDGVVLEQNCTSEKVIVGREESYLFALFGAIGTAILFLIPYRKISKFRIFSKREKLQKLLPEVYKSSENLKKARELEKKIYE
jgi:hypothetical protein